MKTTTPHILKNLTSWLLTLVLVLAAVLAAHALYERWTDRPWTRDGQVRADIVKIAPRVAGYVVEVAVKDNQLVRKGELLFKIDPSSYQLSVKTAQVQLVRARQDVAALAAAVSAAEAQVAEARAAATSAKGGIAKAQSGIRSAAAAVEEAKAAEAAAVAMIKQAEAVLAETEKESDRAQRLLKDRAGSVEDAQQKAAAVAVSQASLDSARANQRQVRAKVDQAQAGQGEAEAELTIAQNSLAEATAALATAQANVVQAKASLGEPGDANVRVQAAMVQLEEAELELSWTSMHAPFDGYVTNLDVNEGAFGFPGIPIAAFVDASSFRVDAYFQENKLKNIQPGDRAVITLMGHHDQPLEGEVESIGYAIRPPNLADTEGPDNLVPTIEPTFEWIRLAQRVPVRIRLKETPHDLHLVSGMTASISIQR